MNFKFFIEFGNRYIETPLPQNKNLRSDVYGILNKSLQNTAPFIHGFNLIITTVHKTSDFHLVLMPNLDFSYEVFMGKCDQITNRIRKKTIVYIHQSKWCTRCKFHQFIRFEKQVVCKFHRFKVLWRAKNKYQCSR